MFFKNPFKKEKTTLWTLPAPTGKVRRLEGAVLAGQSLQSVQAHFPAQAEERPVSAKQDVPAAALSLAFSKADALDIGIAALARLSGLNKAERAFFAREK